VKDFCSLSANPEKQHIPTGIKPLAESTLSPVRPWRRKPRIRVVRRSQETALRPLNSGPLHPSIPRGKQGQVPVSTGQMRILPVTRVLDTAHSQKLFIDKYRKVALVKGDRGQDGRPARD